MIPKASQRHWVLRASLLQVVKQQCSHFLTSSIDERMMDCIMVVIIISRGCKVPVFKGLAELIASCTGDPPSKQWLIVKDLSWVHCTWMLVCTSCRYTQIRGGYMLIRHAKYFIIWNLELYLGRQSLPQWSVCQNLDQGHPISKPPSQS